MAAERSYAFDTSSLITIHRQVPSGPSRDAIWRALGEREGSFSVRIVEPVFVEIAQKQDETAARLERLIAEGCLVTADEFREPGLAGSLDEVRRAHPRMSRRRKQRNRADAWIVAYALFVPNTTVVTEESPRRNANIPAACRAYGIECIDLDEFLRRESLI